jgi:hypothetical protein
MSCKFCSAEKTITIGANRATLYQWEKLQALGFHVSCTNLGDSKVEICQDCLLNELLELSSKWFNNEV